MTDPTTPLYQNQFDTGSVGGNRFTTDPMTDTTTPTFEPDWATLSDVAWDGQVRISLDDSLSLMWERSARAVITEYQRQLAEADMVVVRREDIRTILMLAEDPETPEETAAYERMAALGR
jgi:hypothetical protein